MGPSPFQACSSTFKWPRKFPIQGEDSRVLYLGASSGTTPSHISDIASSGLIYCVEFSPRMVRDLVELCRLRENMVPLLNDATKPREYMHMVEKVDVLYSDVAQPQQSELSWTTCACS